MKIGVIARTEIATWSRIQTRNFVEHLSVAKTLIINMPTRDCDVDDSWCPEPTSVAYDARTHSLDEQVVRRWLHGLDVVFTVETPYDWRIPHWCRHMGIRLVVQGNPEFVRHGQPGYEHYGDPIWWWPTSWRLDQLPAGQVVPVPMPDRPNVAADPDDGPLRILHVVGKRATPTATAPRSCCGHCPTSGPGRGHHDHHRRRPAGRHAAQRHRPQDAQPSGGPMVAVRRSPRPDPALPLRRTLPSGPKHRQAGSPS